MEETGRDVPDLDPRQTKGKAQKAEAAQPKDNKKKQYKLSRKDRRAKQFGEDDKEEMEQVMAKQKLGKAALKGDKGWASRQRPSQVKPRTLTLTLPNPNPCR